VLGCCKMGSSPQQGQQRGNGQAQPPNSIGLGVSDTVQPCPAKPGFRRSRHYALCWLPPKTCNEVHVAKGPSTTKKGTAEWYLLSAQGSTKQGGVTPDLCSSNEGSPRFDGAKGLPNHMHWSSAAKQHSFRVHILQQPQQPSPRHVHRGACHLQPPTQPYPQKHHP
jgi:hypothetical protein